MAYNLLKLWLAWQLRWVNPLLAYGEALFNALSRLTISTAFEAGCVRRHPISGGIQVGIARRSALEKFWPNQGHLPGAVYRPFDTPQKALIRLIKKEFGWLTFSQCILVGIIRPVNEMEMADRGHTNSELWMILNADFGSSVFWIDAEDPLRLADWNLNYRHIRDLIPELVQAFLRYEEGGLSSIPRLEVFSSDVEVGQ